MRDHHDDGRTSLLRESISVSAAEIAKAKEL
jgi:hypothetical protein